MYLVTHSAEETQRIGATLGKQLSPNSVVCFFGDLGAGKTTFIKGLVSGALGTSGHEVSSPTFTYLNIYQGSFPFYHFDLYRLQSQDDFLAMGFGEMFEAGGICCIEWAEKLDHLHIPHAIKVEITHLSKEERGILITGLAKNGAICI